MGYRPHLKAGQVVLLGNKLLLFKILKIQNKALLVIIVPEKIEESYLIITMVVPVEVTWGNIKHSTDYA